MVSVPSSVRGLAETAAIEPPNSCHQLCTLKRNQCRCWKSWFRWLLAFQMYTKQQNAKNARKLTHVFADHSPRIGIPERRKKSSGASRPSIVNTTSLGIACVLPTASRSVAEVGSIFCTEVCIISRTEPGALSPRMYE